MIPQPLRLLHRIQWLLLGALIVVGPAAARAATPIGYVVSVEGESYAQAPGEEPRLLACDDPIYRHDLVTTLDHPGLAIMSGDAYVRLGGNSKMHFRTLNSGPPDLDLEIGQVRVIDMGDGSRTSRIETPGLVLADARSNSEAIVFPEKIWTVSIVCSRDDRLAVERRGNATERMTSAPGQCTIAKPKEPLYLAAASHESLGLLARDACGPLEIQLGLADRFTPGDAAGLLPAVAAGPPPMPPPIAPAMAPTLPGCTVGGACSAKLGFIPAVPVGVPGGPP